MDNLLNSFLIDGAVQALLELSQRAKVIAKDGGYDSSWEYNEAIRELMEAVARLHKAINEIENP